MRYRQSLVNCALKCGVSRVSRKYNKSRSYIYFWLNRYDGSLESLRPHSKRVQIDVKAVPRKCIADSELRLYQYTAIEEH